MNKDKREPEYPAELESQFILRLPEEPAKVLKELLKSGDGLKNRLAIQIENDMRNGEVRLDHWLMHAKIIDLPTIIESLKTIDNKSFYKTADICQMMICKEEQDQTPSEEEAPSKHKKKDPYKVDKKFLWPHGITPPTKNVRKRRFRKTLKKKYVEAPEIEKEVKRLLRADNEACQLSWEVIKEEDDPHSKSDAVPTAPSKPEKKTKPDRHKKDKEPGRNKKDKEPERQKKVKEPARHKKDKEPGHNKKDKEPERHKKDKEPERNKKDREPKPDTSNRSSSSNVVDIFGGAVSDSDPEEDRMPKEHEESHMSPYDCPQSDASSVIGMGDVHKPDSYPIEFESQIFQTPTKKKSSKRRTSTVTSTVTRSGGLSPEDDVDYLSRDTSKDNMSLRIEQLRTELEELKQRRQRTQHEIAGMENVTLRQRFQEILHTLNQDVMYKEMEYQGLITLQNSEDI